MLDGCSGKLTSLATLLMAPVLIYLLLALSQVVSDMHVHCMIYMYMYMYIIHYCRVHREGLEPGYNL